jgi:hypothetical protein
MRLFLLSALLAAATAGAQTLELDPRIVTRQDALHGALCLSNAVSGEARLTLDWSDGFGRTVAREVRTVQATGTRVPFELPLARAVAALNFLQVALEVNGRTFQTPTNEFVVTPSAAWDDYQVIMCFAGKTPAQQRGLRAIGFTAGEIASGRTANPNGGRDWWLHGYPFACTQIAKSFYSAYHTPAQNPKNKALLDAKALYQKDRSKKDAFLRQPCLSDPAAIAAAAAAVRKAVESQMRFKPIFYDLADEAGVADLVSAWDFDFSPAALDAMRTWLLQQYGSLEAINAAWGTNFAKLEEVVPLSTDEMMARGGANLSPWADHRLFMNRAFADAVAAGVQAGHAADPDARLGLEGCQMPAAFGGYDYWLLSQILDNIEPYNIGNSRELWRSFAPRKPAISTGFGFDRFEIWRLWHQALHGDLGLYVYDEKFACLDADGQPTPAGLGIAPTYREFTGGLVKQLRAAQRVDDPIAIHYSQSSLTAHWMLEVRPEGRAWVNRLSSTERRQSDFLRLRESWTKLLEDGLHQYTFAAYAQLETGDFAKSGAKVLILPQSIAMSARECQAVRDFVAAGGTVIADCRTALLDSHCKALAKGQLDDLFGIVRSDTKFAPGPAGLQGLSFTETPAFLIRSPLRGAMAGLDKLQAAEPGVQLAAGGVALCADAKGTPAFIVRDHGKGKTIYLNAVVTDYHRWRLRPPEGTGLLTTLSAVIKEAGVTPAFDVAVADADGKPAAGVEVFPFACGDLRLLALHRNYALRVSELGPTEYQKQNELEKPLTVTVKLPSPCAAYDVRAGRFLGQTNAVAVALDKHQPSILAFLPEPAQALQIEAPASAAPGDLVNVNLTLTAPKPGAKHVFRVTVTGPDGRELDVLAQNVAAPRARTQVSIPFAHSDAPGTYRIAARDIATGVAAEQALTLSRP